jgi:hypothetical protein
LRIRAIALLSFWHYYTPLVVSLQNKPPTVFWQKCRAFSWTVNPVFALKRAMSLKAYLREPAHPNPQEVLEVGCYAAPVGKPFSRIIFTTLKKFHRASGDPKIFRVLRLPENRLVKLQHKTYMSSSKTFWLHPLTLTEREVLTIDAFTA